MGGSKWDKTISSIKITIKKLRNGYDRFRVVLFSDDINVLSYKNARGCILADNNSKLIMIKALQNTNVGGNTNITAALLKAVELIKIDILLLNNENNYKYNYFMSQIIFITDGKANRGECDTHKIITHIQNANDLSKIDKYNSKISINSFGVGKDGNDSEWVSDLNHSFLKLLSVNNNGLYQRIKKSSADESLGQYFAILSKPILSNINIEYTNKNINNLTVTKINKLYSGNDLIICGKFDNKQNSNGDHSLSLTITAITGKKVKANNKSMTKPIVITKRMKIRVKDNLNEEKKDNSYSKKYKVIFPSGAKCRENKDKSSKEVGIVPQNDIVTVEEIVDLRCRISSPIKGWVSLQTNDGKDIILENTNKSERIWAYLKLQQFATEKVIYTLDDKKKEDIDKLALSLALKYKFITPWTSMIVVKPKDNTEQKVEQHLDDDDTECKMMNDNENSAEFLALADRVRKTSREGGGSDLSRMSNDDLIDWIQNIHLPTKWKNTMVEAVKESAMDGDDLMYAETSEEVGDLFGVTNPMAKTRVFLAIKKAKQCYHNNKETTKNYIILTEEESNPIHKIQENMQKTQSAKVVIDKAINSNRTKINELANSMIQKVNKRMRKLMAASELNAITVQQLKNIAVRKITEITNQLQKEAQAMAQQKMQQLINIHKNLRVAQSQCDELLKIIQIERNERKKRIVRISTAAIERIADIHSQINVFLNTDFISKYREEIDDYVNNIGVTIEAIISITNIKATSATVVVDNLKSEYQCVVELSISIGDVGDEAREHWKEICSFENQTNYEISNLNENSMYGVRVKFKKDGCYGPYSNKIKFRTS
eukprot:214921_1